MQPVTLQTIQAKQTELAMMIMQFKDQQESREIDILDCTITLQPGEHYAGAVLDTDGEHLHHLVLMADVPDSKLAWQSAMDWATSVGGALPTRQEQALLFANCNPHLKPAWPWSSETHAADASSAWVCYFDNGGQYDYSKSCEGSAVAVRRV